MKKPGGALLRKKRLEMKLSQLKAAELIRSTQSMFSLYEAGKSTPPLAVAVRIEKRFGVPVGAWA
jgi:transcriptional regulator with XRE-family HTH domain